jgi:hypothetical protein
MSRIILADFLSRVQAAGGDLSGCLLTSQDQRSPHEFVRLITSRTGYTRVEVKTGGSSHIAKMIDNLIVDSISIATSSKLVHNSHMMIRFLVR